MRKTMRVIVVIAIVVACGAVLFYFNQGDVRNVQRTIPESAIYSRQDIAGAMDIVEGKFKQDFEGCTLTDLWYDEDKSTPESDELAAQYHADEAIVLLSNYRVDSSGGDESPNANSAYTDWSWVLVRKTGGPWELMTCGLG